MNKQTHLALIFFITLTGCSGTKPELGLSDGQLKPCPKTPNCVNSQAPEGIHSINPLYYTETLQEAQDRLIRILYSGKRTTLLSAQQDYIRAQFTSGLFRFIDDVEFYFPESQGGKKIIHFRSASRLGYSDFGTNRKRMEKIRSAFHNPDK